LVRLVAKQQNESRVEIDHHALSTEILELCGISSVPTNDANLTASMAPSGESIYFPPLEKCLSDGHQLM